MIQRKISVGLIAFIFASLCSMVVTSRIPLGSKLSAAERKYWVSPNGNFAFGFFNRSDQPNQYGLGIRFNSRSIPAHQQAVVWVAGADVYVGGGDSNLRLSEDGNLALFDSSKGIMAWTSNTSHLSVVSAALRDDGNLVLMDEEEVVFWQSFETPSDTLLPGQRLKSSQTLRAAGWNSVSSYYSASMDATGQLGLSWETNVSYWRTEASSPSRISTAIFTSNGALELLDQRLRPVWSRFGDDHNDSLVSFRFLRLGVDGNLRMYSWAEESKSWRSVWQAVENQCDVFATCGLHGICFFTPSGNTDCKCPFGLSYDSNPNCLAPYDQKCRSGTSMVALEHTFLYGMYPPEDAITQSSLEECRNSCLQDPLCTSVTVTNDGNAQCRMKQTQYVTGYEDPSLASVSFVKMCLDPVAALPRSFLVSSPPSSSPSLLERSHRFRTFWLIGAASGTLTVIFIIQVIAGLCLVRRRRKAMECRGATTHLTLNSIGLASLSSSEIKDVTNNFRHQLSPNIYKGVLPSNKVVVIKDMKDIIKSGNTIEEKQFRCWVSVLGSIHHKNLVKLEAYCCQSEQRFLVYQFMKNGSVDNWIKETKLSKRLTWRKRMDICVGVARALAYLHSGCREFVSHGNLKWKNVVLDEDLEAKVTDYGLEKLGGRACKSARAAEEDVARFGEMAVVLVSGHRDGDEVCNWAYKEWVEGHVEKVVDSRIGGNIAIDEVERTLRVAFWCLQGDERLRPSMGEVVKVLEGTLPVDPPPPPFTCFRSSETD